jgi:hypothetical protein
MCSSEQRLGYCSVLFSGFRSRVAHCSQVFVEHGMKCRGRIDVATTRLTVSTADHVVNSVDTIYLVTLTPSAQDRYIGKPGHGNNPDTAERSLRDIRGEANGLRAAAPDLCGGPGLLVLQRYGLFSSRVL